MDTDPWNSEAYETPDILPGDRGAVYVISEGTENVKIGFSTVRGLASRLGTLQTGNPRKLVVSYHLECSLKEASVIEKRAHYLLSDSKILGEWFGVSIERAISTIHEAKDYEDSHRFRLAKLAELNDAINEKRTLEAKESQEDDNKPEQSIFDMMLEEGNFAPETRRKRSIFND